MKVIYFIISIFIFLSCQYSNETNTVEIKNKYSIDLPAFLNSTRDLHPYASLQYQNRMQEFYVIVIDDIIDDNYSENISIDEFSKGLFDDFISQIRLINKSEIIKDKINGKEVRKIEINGNIDGNNAFILILLIEGDDDYYNIMTWTLKNNKQKYKSTMYEIVNSFNEL